MEYKRIFFCGCLYVVFISVVQLFSLEQTIKNNIKSNKNPAFLIYSQKQKGKNSSVSNLVRRLDVDYIQPTSINIKFLPPEFSNGEKLKYEMEYTFQNPNVCDRVKSLNVTQIINKRELFSPKLEQNGYISKQITQLRANWEYSVRVRAINKEGPGYWSDAILAKTKKSAPDPVTNLTADKETSTSVHLSWTMPCHSGGDHVTYSVLYQEPQAKWPRVIHTNKTQCAVLNLESNALYNFTVISENEFGKGFYGPFVLGKTLQAAPRNLDRLNVIDDMSCDQNKTVSVSWIHFGANNDHKTSIVAEALATNQNNLVVSSCVPQGNNQTFCKIKHLKPDTDYTIRVRLQSCLKGVCFDSDNLQTNYTTSSSVPGEVSGVILKPEANVTKPRSLTIVWEGPKNRRGTKKLQSFTIIVASNNKEITRKVSPNEYSVTVLVRAETNYTVKISASSSCGEGFVRSEGPVFIPAGAPLLPLGKSIIALSSISEKDITKKLKILIPYLYACDTSNGRPTKWYIVVANAMEAERDGGFCGSKEEFDKKRIHYFKTIHNLNFASVNSPSIVKEIQDPCNDTALLHPKGQKSVTLPIKANACEDDETVSTHCNRYAGPNKEFRAKIIVCTNGGCCESKYSHGISKTLFKSRIQKSVQGRNRQRLDVAFQAIGVIFFPVIVFGLIACCISCKCCKKSEGILVKEFSKYMQEFPKHRKDEFQNILLEPSNTSLTEDGETRVKLSKIDNEEGSDIINANYIRMPAKKSDVSCCRRVKHCCCSCSTCKKTENNDQNGKIIACQTPTRLTQNNFWRMVWEEDIKEIVTFRQNQKDDVGEVKAKPYLPQKGHSELFGDILVSTKEEKHIENYRHKKIYVSLVLGDIRRKVRLYSFLGWPNGVDDDVGSTVKSVENIFTETTKKSFERKILIHCSDGSEKTGVCLALAIIIEQLKEGIDRINIPKVVKELRECRPCMFNKREQCELIYKCVENYLKSRI